MSSLLAFSLAPLLAGGAFGATPPISGQINAMVRDSAGNLYVGGGAKTVPPTSMDSKGAFVAKLSSDGSAVIFHTFLSTNDTDGVTALAIAPDGSILAAGLTEGNFPVSKHAAELQPFGPPVPTGFFAKLNSSGSVVYASYLNPSSSSQFGIISSLAMDTDSVGAAYITGEGIFDSTPGALPQAGTPQDGFFTVKLDQTGKQVWATGGIGGSSILVDSQGFIYIAGSAAGGFPLPVTPGVFQPNSVSSACGGNSFFFLACSNQYLAKIDPTASQLVYCTWLSGTYGASPSTLLIDSEGDAILAGSTQSSDYPVTPGAFQTASFASQPLPPPTAAGLGAYNPVPPNTGYVTKINATGTALVFSTYLGGSVEDSVSATAEDADGDLYLAGFASSPDFPGISGVPNGCRPSFIYPAPYVTRLSADASYLSETRLAYGLFSRLCRPLAALRGARYCSTLRATRSSLSTAR